MPRFERLIMPHLPVAWNLARWLARNDADAEDVVQEACLRALRYLDGFQGLDARAWLLTIVRNAFYDSLPHKPPHDEFDEAMHGEADSATNPEQLALRANSQDEVNAALRSLPPQYREVLILREMSDFSYRDIAIITGVPVGTVMSRLSRARSLLLQQLTAFEEGMQS